MSRPPAPPSPLPDAGARDGEADASPDASQDASDDATDDAGMGGDATADGMMSLDAGPPLRVLFVGNSYTGVNNLPAVVQAIGAVTPGGAVEVESITPGGTRLRDHWMTTGARERVEAAEHDVVVMQGQSLEAITAPMSFGETAALFSAAFTDAGATGVWYATWARREGDPFYQPAVPDPVFMASAIESTYALAAGRNDELVARVGAAWLIALDELPGTPLHASDGSHPVGAGTLLAACVIHQAITRQTPRVPDPPPLGIDLATAEALCAIAPRVQCLEGERFCDSDCVDTLADSRHCGACGMVCGATETCDAGVCL